MIALALLFLAAADAASDLPPGAVFGAKSVAAKLNGVWAFADAEKRADERLFEIKVEGVKCAMTGETDMGSVLESDGNVDATGACKASFVLNRNARFTLRASDDGRFVVWAYQGGRQFLVRQGDDPAPAAPAPAAAVPKGKRALPKLLVLDLAANGVPAGAARTLSEAVLGELHARSSGGVLGMSDVKALLGLEAAKQLAGCSESECIAQVGGAMGANLVISGSVGALGSARVLSLVLLDVAQAKVLARAQRKAGEDLAALADAVPGVVEELIAQVPAK